MKVLLALALIVTLSEIPTFTVSNAQAVLLVGNAGAVIIDATANGQRCRVVKGGWQCAINYRTTVIRATINKRVGCIGVTKIDRQGNVVGSSRQCVK